MLQQRLRPLCCRLLHHMRNIQRFNLDRRTQRTVNCDGRLVLQDAVAHRGLNRDRVTPLLSESEGRPSVQGHKRLKEQGETKKKKKGLRD